MVIEALHIRPSNHLNDWQDLKAELRDASMAAVMVDDTVDWRTLMGVARVVAFSHVPVVAAHGKRSEELHDLVDLVALSEREFGPITTWEDDGLDDFIFNITFSYRGLLNTTDQDRKTLICYVSESDSIPEDVALAIEGMRLQQL